MLLGCLFFFPFFFGQLYFFHVLSCVLGQRATMLAIYFLRGEACYFFLEACSLLVNQQLGKELKVLEWQSPTICLHAILSS